MSRAGQDEARLARAFTASRSSDERMRVLHLTQSSAPGGIQRLLRELVPVQLAAGMRVAVACPPTTGLHEPISAAGATPYVWNATRGFEPISIVREIGRLRAIVADFEPDLVHLHSSKAGLIGRLAHDGPGVFQPQAWSFHHVPRLLRRGVIEWERIGERRGAVTVCSSIDERREGERWGVAHDVPVVENGIDLSSFPVQTAADRRAARLALGLPPATPVVVCIGRVCKQKGQDLLLDVWPMVVREVPEARLIVVGSGPDERRLRARHVAQVDWVPWQTSTLRHLAAADVVAMPSRWEGMSFALIEALAAGRSVVATDATAMRENIEVVGAGAVVPFDRAVRTNFALELVRRLRSPELTAAEGFRGRARAEELSIERMHERLLTVYRSVLERSPTGSRVGGRNG